MTPIDLDFIRELGVLVKGEIFDSHNPDVLLQDLLEIELPDGKIIDVGWYPEHDPTGRYRITLYECITVHYIKRYYAENVHVALTFVSELIRAFSNVSTLSASSEADQQTHAY